MTWKEQALLAVLAGALGLGALSLYFAGGQRAPSVPPKAKAIEVVHANDAAPGIRVDPMGTPPPPLPPTLAAPAPKIVVEVKGAVRRPDVYRVEEGARVDDLLKEAGGPLEEADLTGINRAALLIDATTLVVPFRMGGFAEYGHYLAENPAPYTLAGQGRAPLPAGAASASAWGAHAGSPGMATGGVVNLNSASMAELDALPRIGPVTAQKIIDYRNETPFQQVEDLLNIHGIGEKTLEDLRPHVTVR
jgi:competence protein ComEA